MASVGRRITDAHERRELKEYNGFLLAEAYEYLGKVSEWLKEALEYDIDREIKTNIECYFAGMEDLKNFMEYYNERL